ncbi:MAG: roadblock/LC7 domain-containing protein [Myxococcota bacterium]|jgi:predicted regulator of Ras-like GTPase activity (Roadblock/LC7/MglB family)|nr:roadblock/LC7 domain-containing protein [Myxococcota bacterium]
MADPKSVLNEMLTINGIREALIVGRDGFVIEHAGDMDADAAGAIMSTVIGAVETMGRDLKSGALFQVMAEFDDGTVIVSPIGRDALLGLAAKKEANLGAIRHTVKKHLPTLERML